MADVSQVYRGHFNGFKIIRMQASSLQRRGHPFFNSIRPWWRTGSLQVRNGFVRAPHAQAWRRYEPLLGAPSEKSSAGIKTESCHAKRGRKTNTAIQRDGLEGMIAGPYFGNGAHVNV
jgi:hypothetical protein